MAKKNNPIDEWSEEKVNKIFSYHLHDMHPLDAVYVGREVVTVEQKRAYLIEVERKFQESFK